MHYDKSHSVLEVEEEYKEDTIERKSKDTLRASCRPIRTVFYRNVGTVQLYRDAGNFIAFSDS